MAEVFAQISFIILIVLAVSVVMRFLKQPLIIGYIISGVIAGPFFLGIIPQIGALNVFSDLGIALLLFIVGLHLSPKVIKEVGKVSLLTGLGQIIFTSAIGYIIAIILGFSLLTSLYIAMALAFSSTIIIMKLLSDKGDLESLYGKISIGFLLVQDLVAIIILIIVSAISEGGNVVSQIGATMLKGVLIISLLLPISLYFLPRFQDFFGKSQEFLFVFSLAWGLGIASVFYYAGLSIEVGALIAGVLLSVSPYNVEMSSRLKPLRDFFIISFFLLLGAQMAVENITQYVFPAIVLSLFVLVGNPFIVMSILGISGYTKKTSFSSGLTVAQISEFSLILIALGVKVGHLSNDILSFVTLVALITIAGSTYMVIYSNQIYSRISSMLSVFERKNVREGEKISRKFDTVLFGYNRIGFSILKSLKKINKKYLVIDFNPSVIKDLRRLGIPSLYGDVDDETLLGELPWEDMKMAISTIPDLETNILLIDKIKSSNPETIIIMRAHTIGAALELYQKGADYVLTPHFVGGDYLGKLIKDFKVDEKEYAKEGKRHIKNLKERLREGHKHPHVERD